MSNNRIGLAAGFCLALGQVAMADDPFSETRPTGARFQMGEWSLVAVRTVDEAGVSVGGVLALRAKQNSAGSNIVSIWYERPVAGQTHWSAKAWDQCDAIKYVKAAKGISDSFDWAWPTDD